VGVRRLLDFEVEVLLSLILQINRWGSADESVFLREKGLQVASLGDSPNVQ
jgi:hypothetical protein